MLLFFYGEECSHCHKMLPLVQKLEKEAGINIEKLETWHDEKNQGKLRDCDKQLCGGVPFFFNTESKNFLCGENSYEKLKEWALPTEAMSPLNNLSNLTNI